MLKRTHTQQQQQQRLAAFGDISLSISFCTRSPSSLEENYFSAGCLFFVYREQTEGLSAANHRKSNSKPHCSHFFFFLKGGISE